MNPRLQPTPTVPRNRPQRTRCAERSLVPVFIAYHSVPAAREAMDRITKLVRDRDPAAELQPMLWRFNQLSSPRGREMALHDALHAHSLVIAMGDDGAFDVHLDRWLRALLETTRGSSVTALVLTVGDEAWTITLAQPGPVKKAALHEGKATDWERSAAQPQPRVTAIAA